MITVSLGTAAPATAVTSLAPSRAMPRCSYSRPTINPVTFCKKISAGRWQATSTKCALEGALGEEDAVVGDDPHRVPLQAGEATDDGGAVAGLELAQPAAVHDAGDHLPHVEGGAQVRGDDPVQLGRVVAGGSTGATSPRRGGGAGATPRKETIRRTMARAWSSFSARWSATPEVRVCTRAPPGPRR